MDMKKECCETNRDNRVVFKEGRSKLTIENPDRVEATKVIVDGCQINEGKRCDYLYLIKEKEIYIELKGQDIKYAIEQLETTIRRLSKDVRNSGKISIVICTRSPLASASIQQFQIKFRKNYNSDFIVKSSPYHFKC